MDTTQNQANIRQLSPVRRDLVKKLCNYYVLLNETENIANNRSKINSQNPSAYYSPKRTYNTFSNDMAQYEQEGLNKDKTNELRAIMKIELDIVKSGHRVDPNYQDWQNSLHGYPTMMTKDQGYKELHRSDIKQQASYKTPTRPVQLSQSRSPERLDLTS